MDHDYPMCAPQRMLVRSHSVRWREPQVEEDMAQRAESSRSLTSQARIVKTLFGGQ